MRALAAFALLAALAAPLAAQPAIAWERVGTEARESTLPYAVTPDGSLLYGGAGPPDAEGYYSEGTWRLPPPAGSTEAWELVGTQPRPGYAWVFALGRDTLLAEAQYGHYRSTDGGRTWALRGDDRGSAQQVLEVPAGPYAGRVLVATDGYNASFSDDRGGSWRHADDGTQYDDSLYVRRAAVVTAGPHTGRVVGAGLWGITLSDDGGETWRKAPGEWAYFQQSADCVATLRGQAPGGGDRLLAVVNDIRILDDSVRVTVSDDGGETWARIGALPRGPSRTCSEAVDLGGGRAVAVLLKGSVYGTEDGGRTWAEWPNPRREGDSLTWAFVGPGGHLYVGVVNNHPSIAAYDVRTAGPVVAVSGEGAPEAASGARLSIEPNPASGEATVRLVLASPEAEVRVSVFDARGREVAVVASGARGAGAHVLSVDTSAWASGVYVVRAVVGSEVASGRFVVAR